MLELTCQRQQVALSVQGYQPQMMQQGMAGGMVMPPQSMAQGQGSLQNVVANQAHYFAQQQVGSCCNAQGCHEAQV